MTNEQLRKPEPDAPQAPVGDRELAIDPKRLTMGGLGGATPPSESSLSGTVELDLQRMWTAPHPAPEPEPEPGSPEGELEIGDSDEAHSATAAALAEAVALDLGSTDLPATAAIRRAAIDEALARSEQSDESFPFPAPTEDSEPVVVVEPKLIAVEERMFEPQAAAEASIIADATETANSRWVFGAAAVGGVLVMGLIVTLGARLGAHEPLPQRSAALSAAAGDAPSSESNEPDPASAKSSASEGDRSDDALPPTPPGATLAEWEQVVARCQANDPLGARKLFRAMVGSELRKRAIIGCREQGIDVTAKSEGHTGPELLVMAQHAYAKGDVKQAYVHARDSSREHRSRAALKLMGTAACELGDEENAARVLGMLMPRDKDELRKRCADRGIKLP